MDGILYKAAKKGDVVFLDQIMSHGEKQEDYLCSQTHQGNNIVHVAARFGHEKFAGEALNRFPSLLHQKNSRGDTPLHVAARAGSMAVVKLLIEYAEERTTPEIVEHPPLWRMTNLEENTALHEALRNDHEEVATHLLFLDHELSSFVNRDGESPLYLAAEARLHSVLFFIVFEKLLMMEDPLGQNPLVGGPMGRNPLHAAVFAGSVASTRLLVMTSPGLIKRGDNSGKTALHYAAAANSIRIIRVILTWDAKSAYVQDTDGNYPLHDAASSGSPKTVRAILKFCPETTELLNKTGRNALHLAVRYNNHKIVRRLLKIPEMRDLLNEKDNEGNTPLHIATTFHHYQMVRELIKTNSVDLRAKNKKGLTASDICESEWEHSYQQKFFVRNLVKQKASLARNSSQDPTSHISGATFAPSNENLTQVANTLTVVATLLATVTFAAAFTMPVGYSSSGDNVGVASLAKKAALQAFVLSDTVAMCCSMIVVFRLTSAMVGDPALIVEAIKRSSSLLAIALYGAMVAFETGLYVVLAPESLWLAIIVCIMASIVPFVINWARLMSVPYNIILQRSKNKITKEKDQTAEEKEIEVAVE